MLLSETIKKYAKQHPDAVFIDPRGGSYSYPAILDRIAPSFETLKPGDLAWDVEVVWRDDYICTKGGVYGAPDGYWLFATYSERPHPQRRGAP